MHNFFRLLRIRTDVHAEELTQVNLPNMWLSAWYKNEIMAEESVRGKEFVCWKKNQFSKIIRSLRKRKTKCKKLEFCIFDKERKQNLALKLLTGAVNRKY